MPLVTLQVSYETASDDEVVCVTGSIPALGAWAARAVKPLIKESGSSWSYPFDAPADCTVCYRYAVCSFLSAGLLVVHKWEAGLSPRQVHISDQPFSTETETFGNYGGQSKVQRGWLVNTREIRLMFGTSALTPFTPLVKGDAECRLRVMALNLTDAAGKIPVLVNNLEEADLHPRLQAEGGEAMRPGSDVITFTTQGLQANQEVKFIIQVVSSRCQSAECSPSKKLKGEVSIIGEGGLVSNTLTNSVGSCPIYFFSKDGSSLGSVPVSYAVIESLDDPDVHSFEVTYATHWKRRAETLNIGHRGMGRSLKDHSLIKTPSEEKLVSVPENTILSLKEAADHGADFVEFDVHVTRDGYPVLYHDFDFSLCVKEKLGGAMEQVAKIAIKDLTLAQLHVIRNFAPGREGKTEFVCETVASSNEDGLAFGKLQTALEAVPVTCGFDIEVKYPMSTVSGVEYAGTPMDMNQSVDAILKVVLKHGGKRRIFFSAFNPDVCAMIRLKQPRYPVMLCNFGPTDLYESYTDPRSSTVEKSILTAGANQLLGLCGHCEDFLSDPALVKACHRAGLALMSWGERTVDPAVRDRLARSGLDGVIHDRMGSFPRGKKNNLTNGKPSPAS